MQTEKPIQIELTEEQKAKILEQTHREIPTVKLNLELLEARLAPGIDFNETAHRPPR